MRITLTYRPTSFRRARIAGIIAIPCIIVFLVSHHFDRLASPVHGIPILTVRTIIAFIGMFFSVGAAIQEVIFVLGHRNPYKLIEFDNHSLYVSEGGIDKLTIPFNAINEIHLAFRNSRTSIRFYAPYLIRYTIDGHDDEVSVSIYSQTSEKFNQFTDWVRCDNPAVQVVNFTYTGEDFYWRLRRRK